MKNLKEYLEEQINENLIQAVLSAGRKADGPSKVKIRPVKLKGPDLLSGICSGGNEGLS